MALFFIFFGLLLYIIPIVIIHIIGYCWWIKWSTSGTTIEDMYDYYMIASDYPIVIFTWIPLINYITLLVIAIVLIVYFCSKIKIR